MVNKVGLSKGEKRKLSGQSTNQETKNIGIDFEKTKKAPLKADLIVQLKTLEKEHEALKIENDKNLETIHKLEIRVVELEENSKQKNVVEGRCDDELDLSFGPRYCKKCDFEAEDGYQLDGHFWAEHDDSDLDLLPCQHCDEKFEKLKDLMNHKKMKHVENVSKCWHFINGFCPFGDETCWFRHEMERKELNGQDKKQIKCNICGEILNSKTSFMKHRKNEHEDSLQFCKLYKKGNCTYNENCWFSHNTIKTKNVTSDNTKMFERDDNNEK